MENRLPHHKDSVAMAAIVSAGLGIATLGIVTVLAELSPKIKELLTWWVPAGSLTGKTGISVIVWLASWVLLTLIFRKKNIALKGPLLWFAFVLIFLGWVGTFPFVFEFFGQY